MSVHKEPNSTKRVVIDIIIFVLIVGVIGGVVFGLNYYWSNYSKKETNPNNLFVQFHDDKDLNTKLQVFNVKSLDNDNITVGDYSFQFNGSVFADTKLSHYYNLEYSFTKIPQAITSSSIATYKNEDEMVDTDKSQPYCIADGKGELFKEHLPYCVLLSYKSVSSQGVYTYSPIITLSLQDKNSIVKTGDSTQTLSSLENGILTYHDSTVTKKQTKTTPKIDWKTSVYGIHKVGQTLHYVFPEAKFKYNNFYPTLSINAYLTPTNDVYKDSFFKTEQDLFDFMNSIIVSRI